MAIRSIFRRTSRLHSSTGARLICAAGTRSCATSISRSTGSDKGEGSLRDPDILACPSCRGEFRRSNKSLNCTGCGTGYGIIDEVPVFLSGEVEILREHASNPIGAEFEEIL